MVTLNCNLLQNCYCMYPSKNFTTALLVTHKIVDSKRQEMHKIISLSVILHYVHYFHPNLKNSSRCKVMCGWECCISDKSLHSSLLSWRDFILKKSNIKVKILKTEDLGENKIAYMKHIKIQSCHIGVIFTPKHMVW